MPYPKVAVVIIHWNRKHLLENFLPSVVASTYPNLEIVLADNASDDGSVEYVQQHFPVVTVVRNDANYGYAGGYNHALKHVQADYYVLLNNDIEVPANWIEPVIDAMEKNKAIAAAQPKMLDYHNKGSFEYAGASGGMLDAYGFPFCRGRIFNTLEADLNQYDEACSVFWSTGACLFIRAELFHAAGGFDEHFFAHMEEIDLCWRLQLMGHEVWAIPQSQVYHVGGGTLDKINAHKTYLNFRNSLIMLYKNLPGKKLWWIIFVRSWLDLLASIHFLSKGERDHSWAVHRAHADFFFHLKKWQQLRKKIRPLKKRSAPLSGLYHFSIVFRYFVLQKHTFKSL